MSCCWVNGFGTLRCVACLASAWLILSPVHSQETTLRDVAGMSLHVDPTLEIESAADPELIKWPIVADWDSAGRLVVVECAGVAKPIAEHNKQLLHRVVRLIDSNGDGKFDQRIVAADRLAFPEGVLCIGNSMLVATPPQIWKLTDKDGDGACEEREVWFDPGTLTGCANDLHGPYLGRDGWIYWCKGAFAEQRHTLLSGEQFVTRASHIFRRRFEGGPIEPVMTGGMDNPVEMAMSHTGERFFTSTFLQHPAAGRRDGIAHAVYGGVYGKPHDVLDGHKRTGELMPIMTHLGPAAPSGLICLESTRLLGPSSRGADTLVAAQFNLHKVTAHTLVPRGAGFVTEDRELVSSERIDFHPTDILEAPDGSLLVIDTGGWYNLCCPSSGVDQAVATGGIYRLTSNTTRQERAPLQSNRWDDMTSQQASAVVGDQQQPLVDRQAALWRICRINSRESHAALVAALKSPEPSLRQIAAHSISVQRVANVASALDAALAQETEPPVQRALAEALGRLGTPESIPVLLRAIENAGDDRYLEHSLLYALIELDQPERLLSCLNSSSVAVQRAALVVLDQLGRSDLLDPADVLKRLTSTDARLRQSAVHIAVAHPDWAVQHVASLEEAWQQSLTEAEMRGSVGQVLAAWISQPEVIQAASERLLAANSAPATEQQALIETLRDIRTQQIPRQWLGGLLGLLKNTEGATRDGLVAWLVTMTPDPADASELRDAILSLSTQQTEPIAKFRLLAALPSGSQLPDGALESLLIASFVGEHRAEAAAEAAKALERVRLSRAGAQQLLAGLERIQPLQWMQAITSIASLQQDDLDQQLLQQLAGLPSARTLPLDQVTTLYRKRSEPLRQAAAEAVAALGKPPADVEAKLDSLLAQMKSGDAARGFQVFRSTKAACSACHRIGYVGGQIGPELTRIGATRTRRALLEAIVFPNARLEQSYTPLRVLTVDGQVFNGLVARDGDGVLELITGATQRVTIAHDDIEQRLPSPVSIMPAGLEQQLTLEELADLLTMLEAAK